MTLALTNIHVSFRRREPWDPPQLQHFDYLAAARVPLDLQPQDFGIWQIQRRHAKTLADVLAIGSTWQTVLLRWTLATLHKHHGDVVMEDSHIELRKHLPIWLAAHGRVLVTGLGLGCVVRGLLIKPEVTHIDVVEVDKRIIRIIGAEFADDPRVTIHHADALTWPIPPGSRWDYAWHDLHDDDGRLQVLHSRLLCRFKRHAARQGAWNLPRWMHRVTRGRLLGSRRRDRRRRHNAT